MKQILSFSFIFAKLLLSLYQEEKSFGKTPLIFKIIEPYIRTKYINSING